MTTLPWIPGTDFRPPGLIFNWLRDYIDAESVIDAKARTLPWLGTAKGVMEFAGSAYFKEYEYGSIFTTRNSNRKYTDAFEVHGLIRERHNALGGSKGVLGAPLSDETDNGDGGGRHNRFQNGVIYWNARTGAFEVYGAILAEWYRLGAIRSWLGYPLTGEFAIAHGRMNSFEGGQILFTNGTTSTKNWRDALIRKYNDLGGIYSLLGLPLDAAMKPHRSTSAFSLDFRAGVIIMNFDSPDAREYVNTRIRVAWTGLECQVKQESNDELIGAVSAWVQPTKQIRALEFPSSGDEEWKLGQPQQRIMNTYGVLYEGPPAGVILTTTLLEHDSGAHPGRLADDISVRHTSVVTGSISELYDRGSGHAGNGLEGAVSREGTPADMYKKRLEEEFDPTFRLAVDNAGIDADHYPSGMLVNPWNSFTKPKQILKRNDDPHMVVWTDKITVSARDGENDLGVYVFYFDISAA